MSSHENPKQTSITIRAAADLSDPWAYYSAIETVFWETANKTRFDTTAERERYRRSYMDHYWETAPELFLLALRSQQVLGYVCGVADTRKHVQLRRLADSAGHIELFADLYDRFPAHLHINLTAASRGQGLGGRLVRALEERLRHPDIQARGLHVVTSAQARNVRFYRHNGFSYEVPRRLGGERGPTLLFMGKQL